MAVVAREGCYLHYMVRGSGPPWLSELAGVPTLVLSGAHDPIAPPLAGAAVAGAIPGARYVQVVDASHTLPITHADLTNQLLREHLGRT